MSLLKFGAFSFDQDTVWFNLSRQSILSPSGRRYKVREIWSIKGTVIERTSQAALSARIAAVDAAFATDGDKDLIFYVDNGVTESSHKRTAASTLNGVRALTKVNWHMGMPGVYGAGAEYSTFRTFSVVLGCEYLDVESNLLAFVEKVRIQRSGGDFVIQEALTGPPVRFNTQEQVRIVATQSGSALGATSYPTRPDPLFPMDLKPRESWDDETTPDFGRNANTNWKTSWHYHFESTTALGGHPTIPSFT